MLRRDTALACMHSWRFLGWGGVNVCPFGYLNVSMFVLALLLISRVVCIRPAMGIYLE
jgi:hypothetical protein